MAAESMATSAYTAPFECTVLVGETGYPEEKLKNEDGLEELAASYRFHDDFIATTRLESRFIEQELNLDRLYAIIQHLWMAGRPVPPRPLHQQLLLRRQIIITEKMDMHLVWGQGYLYLKPILRFLLIPRFWETHLPSNFPESCKSHGFPGRRSLRECALGFLISYAALIAHESDFIVAHQNHLLPPETTWQNWRMLVRQLLTSSSNVQSEVADRFIYGELRLNRLNLIYELLVPGSFPIGYLARWNSYGSFFRENFAAAVAATAYIVIILSAMQVGLTTTRLSDNKIFQEVAYGFAVFSILGPLLFLATVLCLLCIGFVVNWRWSQRNARSRREGRGRSFGA